MSDRKEKTKGLLEFHKETFDKIKTLAKQIRTNIVKF